MEVLEVVDEDFLLILLEIVPHCMYVKVLEVVNEYF